MSASGGWKLTVAMLGAGIWFTGLGLLASGVISGWIIFAFYGPGGCVWLLGMLMPLRRKEVPMPTPPPLGVPMPFPPMFGQLSTPALLGNALGPGPSMQALITAQAEAEAKQHPEPEGEPPTLLGLTGWRMFTVASMRPLVLVGAAGGHVVGRYAEPAICDQGQKHEVPAWTCDGKAAGCGYYVLNDPPRLDEQPVVCGLAKVSPAGRTIRCEKGYRTHRYRLEELWLPPEIVKNVNIEEAEERFGVPIYALERMLPDGDRAKERRDHLRTGGDAKPAPAEEGSSAGAGEGSGA